MSVTDTGVGIAPEDLARLGRPFEQAGDAEQRQAGSGLGLSLVRAFARLHGGDMAIESVVGEGTTVTVRMPVLSRTPTATPSGLRRRSLIGPQRRRPIAGRPGRRRSRRPPHRRGASRRPGNRNSTATASRGSSLASSWARRVGKAERPAGVHRPWAAGRCGRGCGRSAAKAFWRAGGGRRRASGRRGRRAAAEAVQIGPRRCGPRRAAPAARHRARRRRRSWPTATSRPLALAAGEAEGHPVGAEAGLLGKPPAGGAADVAVGAPAATSPA